MASKVGMRVLLPIAVATAWATGCASTVRLELPPTPAVALPADTVAVVARDRACQASADVLVDELGRSPFLAVDPRADLRIDLFNCGEDQLWTIEEIAGPDGPRSRASVVGRAYAVAAVSFEGRVLANLIGAGRDDGTTGWDDPAPVLRTGRAVRRHARADLARDLAHQINPLPTLVDRRVYPKAPSGTARELTTLAVEAERTGDLDAAVALAEAAWEEDPNPRTAGYLGELVRRRALQ